MKKITVDDFTNLKFLSNVTFSPNGKTACLVVTEAVKETNDYKSYIYQKAGKNFKQITSGGKEGGFLFLDDDTLLFPANREENKKPTLAQTYYKISLSGGEAKKAFKLPIPGRVTPLKNGDFLVEGRTFPGYEDLYKGDKELEDAYFKNAKENEDYEIIENNPWWFNGGTFTRGAYGSIYYYNKKKNKMHRLTEVGFNASGVSLSKDEKYFFYTAAKVKPHNDYGDTSLYYYNLETNENKLVIEGTEDFGRFHTEFADSFIYLVAHDKKIGTGMNFYKMEYSDFSYTLLNKFNESLGSSVGSDVRFGHGGRSLKVVGDTLYFIATINDGSYLYQLKDGKVDLVVAKDGSVDDFDCYKNKLLMIALYDMQPQEVYDETLNCVSKFNKKALKDKYVAYPEFMKMTVPAHTDSSKHFYNYPEHEIHGFVLKPYEFDPNKKYPVIIDIHGGPKTVYGPVFYHEMQYWTSKGYFVIYCNPTGSDGRCNEKFDDIYGKYGTIDFDDLMYFCDKALEAYPQMDKDNFFETGGSYGGFMTNWIIGHTNRFKACASQRSISNWFSFYGVADIGIGFLKTQHEVSVWSDPEKLWWHSPMKYLDKCTTPTLFIHSNEDYRCPIDQGYQMVTSLIDHGVPTRLVHFKGENHELSRSGKPLHRIKRLNEITGWFDKYKDECYK